MRAKEIMTQDVVTIKGSATVAEAVRLMRLRGLRSLIVEPRTPEDAYGIVTETDIAAKVVAYGKDPQDTYIYEIMTKPCIVVNPDLGIEYVARLFANTGIWRAPVIQGELLGVISVTDIITKGDFTETPKIHFLKKELHKAISNARSIAASMGEDSLEAIEAWETVDEIEAEACFHGMPKLDRSSREQFADNGVANELVTAGSQQ